MKALVLTLLVFSVAIAPEVHADAPPAASKAPADPFAAPAASANNVAPAAGARPSDEAIRAAVRAVLDEMPDSPMPTSGTALSGGAYREFSRKFSEAQKPHCLGPNATRSQPAGFSTKNWNFGAGGLFALPFWGAAILRGKCSW